MGATRDISSSSSGSDAEWGTDDADAEDMAADSCNAATAADAATVIAAALATSRTKCVAARAQVDYLQQHLSEALAEAQEALAIYAASTEGMQEQIAASAAADLSLQQQRP